jgi:membrane-associated phospholipid phosphatase
MQFFLKNTRYIVISIVSTIIIYTREWEALVCSLGGILCGLTAKILKQWIKEPRPSKEPMVGDQSVFELFHSSNDYGMPSSHTASLVYFATYATFRLSKIFVVLIWTAVFFTMWSRIFYNYHTTSQVVAGFVLGFSFAGLFLCLAM